MSKKKLVIGSVSLVVATIICTILVQVFLLKGVFISRNLYNQYKKYDKLVALENIVEEDYYQDVDQEKLILGAEKGLIQSLGDPYSEYYTKEEFNLLKEQTQGSFVGIGIYMSGNDEDNVVVKSVIWAGIKTLSSTIVIGDVTVFLRDISLLIKWSVRTSLLKSK